MLFTHVWKSDAFSNSCQMTKYQIPGLTLLDHKTICNSDSEMCGPSNRSLLAILGHTSGSSPTLQHELKKKCRQKNVANINTMDDSKIPALKTNENGCRKSNQGHQCHRVFLVHDGTLCREPRSGTILCFRGATALTLVSSQYFRGEGRQTLHRGECTAVGCGG